MDIQMLRSFLVVAREKNITKAAQLLHITQPALSRQLSSLEDELGVILFSRKSRSISLTDEGFLFKQRAQELLNLAESTKAELQGQKNILHGKVLLACTESSGLENLSQLVAGFSRLYPHVQFQISSGDNNENQYLLENGSVDIAMLQEPVELDSYNYVRLDCKDEWGVLVAKSSRLFAFDHIRPGDLVDMPLITIRNALIHNELTSWSGKYANMMRPVIHYTSASIAASLVRTGLGTAVCVRPCYGYDNLKFIPFQPKIELGVVLVWKDRQQTSAVGAAFIDYIKSHQS